MDDLKELFNVEIIWKEVTPGGVEFIAEINGEKYELRMNDFPDEPLYTISYKGMELDFDDAPKIWKIPPLKD